MKVMVMVERLKNNISLVIMQLGNEERRRSMLEVNGMIISPLINERVGIIFNRAMCEERQSIVGANSISVGSAISHNDKVVMQEADKYGFGCRVGVVGDLFKMLEKNEVTHLAFAAPTTILNFITDGATFNEHYALQEDKGVLDMVKQALLEYSAPSEVDGMIADLQK